MVTPARQHAADILRVGLVTGAFMLLAAALIIVLTRTNVFDSSTGATQGSGVAATQSRALSAFDRVELSGANNVVVQVGGKQAVTVHADHNLLTRVKTKVVAGTLVVTNRGSFTTSSPMRVDVTVPSLRAVSLSGSGMVTVAGIHVGALHVTLAGSGVIHASGTVDRLDVSLSGSGDAQLQELVARNVLASVSGSGRIAVNATDTLDARVPGTGLVMYRGDPPHVTTSVTGTGAIVRG